MSRVSVLVCRGLSCAVRRAGLAAALCFPLTLAVPATAQTVRLNEPFVYGDVVGDVRDFQLDAGDGFVFFRADDRLPGVVELFAVPALGGLAPKRENVPLLRDRSVLAYQSAAVGQWIVFVADQDAEDVFELYSRSPTDPAPRKLSASLSAGGDVTSFAIAPDGARVVYVADQDSDEVFELYAVPIDGSASPVKLSGPPVAGGDVRGYLISPTGNRVVYHADQAVDEKVELYSVPIDGSGSWVRLNGALAAQEDVAGYVPTWGPAAKPALVSPDGSTVVFRAGRPNRSELFRVPIDRSSAPVRVNGTLVTGGSVRRFDISPDSARVVYTAEQDTQNAVEIYSALLSGSPPVNLHGSLPPEGHAGRFVISPDSSRVVMEYVFVPRPEGAVTSELRSGPIDGSSSPVLLDGEPFGRELAEIAISPNSSRVVYLTGTTNGDRFSSETLRSVPIDGSAAPIRLDDAGGSPPFQLDVETRVPFALSVNSGRVVYLWTPDGGGDEDLGLYSVPITRSAPPIALAPAGASRAFATSPVGSRAFFVADLAGTGVSELYSASLLGTGLVELNGDLALSTFADVALPDPSTRAFELLPSGAEVVHAADAEIDGEFELFAGPVDGGAYTQPLHTQGIVERFVVSPDGERVVYSAGGLYSVPADGGAAPVQLFAGAIHPDFAVSADSAWVLFRSPLAWPIDGLYSVPIAGGAAVLLEDEDVLYFTVSATGRAVYLGQLPTGDLHLHSVPVDGSSAPILLDFGSHPDFYPQALTPDGELLAYRGDPAYTFTPALWSVRVDGSAAPTPISGYVEMGPALEISSDGLWVVFSGVEIGGSAGLFTTRIDGSLGPLKLNGPLTQGGAVWGGFIISPDSSRVLYVATQEDYDVLELYSAPIDASESPVKLNGPMTSGGDVSHWRGNIQFAPDSSRVLYTADQDVDGVLELYSVPIDGSASEVKLNGALVDGGALVAFNPELPFKISPDSKSVVYLADQEVDGLQELFLTSIDGSSLLLRLTKGLSKEGVSFFEITADSRRVVYQATERSGVTELFSTALTFARDGHVADGGPRRP